MDTQPLPPAYRLARLALAAALVMTFGAGTIALVASGRAAALVAAGQDIAERARELWSGQ